MVNDTSEFTDKNATSKNFYGIDLDKRNDEDKEIQKKLHQTVKKVTESMEDNFHFNTAIAGVMELLNDMTSYKQTVIDAGKESSESKKIWKEVLEKTILLISPFAPHISDELWVEIGNEDSTFIQEWPKYIDELTKEDKVNLVIQVNGKLRDTATIKLGISKEECEKIAFSSDKIKKFLENKEIVKVIVVPNKLVNIVIK